VAQSRLHRGFLVAWGFLNDPDYQPVKEIRLRTTSRGQMVVAPEFRPAG
jgi:hypothetical protein